MSTVQSVEHDVALHETFFAQLAQENPSSHVLREFLRVGWDPFYASFVGAASRGLDNHTATLFAYELAQLRGNASALEIPVPPAYRGQPAVGRSFQGRIVTAPDGVPRSDAALEAISAARAKVEPAEHAINRETDARFWSETGYKPGQRLNPRDPNDAAMINEWLSIRYAVAEAYALDNEIQAEAMTARGQTTVSGRGGPRRGGRGDGRGRRSGGYGQPAFAVADETEIDYATEEEDPMNSTDPYRAMQSSPPALEMVIPPAVNLPVTVGGDRILMRPRGYFRTERDDRALFARPRLVAELAPVLAPATGGAHIALELDAGNVLHASMCIDGKCYQASADVSAPIAAVMAKIAEHHADLHAAASADVGAPPASSGEVAVMGEAAAATAVSEVVKSAGEILVGSMIEGHASVACAGWFSDLEHAASGALHGIEHAASGAVHATMKTLGPMIGPAAAIAAGAVGGPAAAALAGSLVSAAMGHGDAKQLVQQAEAVASQNPQAAAVLADAKSAVAKTTAAYHVAQTVNRAASGDKAARAQLRASAQAAAAGDPAAQQVIAIADQTMGGDGSAAPGPDDGSGGGDSGDAGDASPAVQGWYTIVGLERNGAIEAGHRRHHHHVHAHRVGNMAVTEVTLARQKAAAADAAADAAEYARTHQDHTDTLGDVSNYMRSYERALGVSGAVPLVGTGGPRVEIIGAAVGVNALRDEAIAMARDAWTRFGAAKGYPAFVVAKLNDGQWLLDPYSSADAADDGYGALDPHSFVYAAMFDAHDAVYPEPVEDKVGEVVHASVPHGTIPRGVARVSGPLLPLAAAAALGAGAAYLYDHRAGLVK